MIEERISAETARLGGHHMRNQLPRKFSRLAIRLCPLVLISLVATIGAAEAQRLERGPVRGNGYGGGGYHGGGGGLGGLMGILPILGGAAVLANQPPPQPEPVGDEPPPRHYHPRPQREPITKPIVVYHPTRPIVMHVYHPAAPPPRPAPVFAFRRLPPVAGETRFRAGEVLVEIAPNTAPALITQVLRRHGLTEVEVTSVDLLNVSLRLWRIPDKRDVASVVRELGGEGALLRIQPNYLYSTSDFVGAPVEDASLPAAEAAPAPSVDPGQYSLVKMHVDPSLETSVGEPVRVAVIDTAIDDSHPDLAGAVEARFDAIGGGAPIHSMDHGTSMAGGIAAHGKVKGVASNVRILSARAFDNDGAGGALGSTLSILKGIDWAVKQRARVINMSFAGPSDPTLHDMLGAAWGKGLILVGAAGNAGPKSPPLYPAADEKVIAVTATDEEDKLFTGANVGPYIAVSAPGVDVLLPAPAGGYAMETGTSVSSALVSGVVALMLEHHSAMSPTEVRKTLTTTAFPLGGAGHATEFGAGLVDAKKAVGN